MTGLCTSLVKLQEAHEKAMVSSDTCYLLKEVGRNRPRDAPNREFREPSSIDNTKLQRERFLSDIRRDLFKTKTDRKAAILELYQASGISKDERHSTVSTDTN